MKKKPSSVKYNIEILRFGIVGFTTIIVDLIFYKFLLHIGFDFGLAKSVSFFIGATYSYFANKKITFIIKYNKSNKVFYFFLVYIFGLLLNVSINSFMLSQIFDFEYKIILCFFISTFFSALSNYFGMKFFVFNIKKIN
jgi:putative flippase GtrA